jgi:hypothetical protein
VNAKRIYRLYIEDGLAVRTRVRKKIAQRSRVLALSDVTGDFCTSASERESWEGALVGRPRETSPNRS